MSVKVRVVEVLANTFAEARPAIEKAARELGLGGWVISQSLADPLVFALFEGTLPENFERSLGGRVFGPAGEVRWVRDVSKCRFWTTVESESGGEPYQLRSRRYYLWGMRTENGLFSENRTVGEFQYPIPAGDLRVDDRAFIEVHEYLAAKPEGAWPEEIEAIERILNQGEIIGHRYVTVGCGRTEA